PAGGAHIRVTYQVDADGLLSVTAMEKSSAVQASIQVKPSYGLSDDEIVAMLRDSMTHAENDVQARMLAEQQVDADRVIESVVAALEKDANLLSADELATITQALTELRAVRHGSISNAIEQAIKNVDAATQDFAARRMDESIRHALMGHSVDDM
ncbi:MAG: Hsp70 family protein, partial [Plesiomonas sp.]